MCLAHTTALNFFCKMKKGTSIKVKIDKVGFQGVGIGILEEKLNQNADIPKNEFGKKVLVQNTLPGEVVLATVFRNKKKYVEAEKLQTILASSLEIKPRCRHFNICGGCKWQNLEYEEQLKIKENHVRETFVHLGGFDKGMIEKIMRPIEGCKEIWHYRNKVEFSFGFDHTMKSAFGFHAEGMRYDIFHLEECFLISPEMLRIAHAVRDFATSRELAPYIYRENRGLLRNLIVRRGENTGETLVNLIISHEEFSDELKKDLQKTLAHLHVTSLYVTSVHTQPGQPTKQTEELISGAPHIYEKMQVGKNRKDTPTICTFQISPSSFFQTNTIQAERLYLTVLKLLDSKADDIVLDLFCGTGTIGLFLAPHVKKVIGIELNKDAVENAKVNATLNSVNNIEFIEGDVGHVLELFQREGRADELKGHKVILDPPRSGLTPQMLEQVLALAPREIIYVSCNPTTQARDVKFLTTATPENPNAFQLASLAVIDMFPHTYHIENVIRLTNGAING